MPCSGANAANAVGKALWRKRDAFPQAAAMERRRASFCRREYFAQFWAAPFFGLVLLFISLAAAAGTGLDAGYGAVGKCDFCCLLCAFTALRPLFTMIFRKKAFGEAACGSEGG